MPEFTARVATPTGEIVERSYVADSEAALRRDLEAEELLVLDLRQRSAILQKLALGPKISSREFMFFNQELAALIRAGLPILASLDILIERRKNERFKRALLDIRNRVKSGESLSEAFANQGDLFPKLYSASLASGERSGELSGVLARYISYTRSVLEVQRKVVQAMIYPIVLLTLSVGLIAVLVFYVIPRFSEFLTTLNAELPGITKAMMFIATFCQENVVAILVSSVGLAIGGLLWGKTEAGRDAIDRFKLKLPLIGSIAHDYAQNRFTRTLATLQAGGIPLVTSLDLSARAVGNRLFERELLAVTQRVREGQSLWESLEETGLMSDIAVEMVKVGESTGALDEMLGAASDFTDEEIDHRLSKVVALIEPLMLVFMAVVVGMMLLSMYLPLLTAVGGQSAGRGGL
jgi:type IV pilus assembly protein PilC